MSATTHGVEIISANDLAELLGSGTVSQLWNVLTDDYFKGEMIAGSRRVPLDQVGREVARTRLPRDAAIVVYCSGPTCPQSGSAAQKLAALGFTNVRQFEGGLEEWKASGRAIERV